MKFDIDKLIKEAETTSNEVLKSAMEKAAEAERQRQERLVLEQYNLLKSRLDRAVGDVREIRRQEKLAVKNAKAVGEAIEAFKKGKSFDKLREDLRKNGVFL